MYGRWADDIIFALKDLRKAINAFLSRADKPPVTLKLPSPPTSPYVKKLQKPSILTPEEWKMLSPKLKDEIEEASKKIDTILKRVDELQREKEEVLEIYSDLYAKVSELRKKLNILKAEQSEELMKAMDLLRREMRELEDLSYKFVKWEDYLVVFLEKLDEVVLEPDAEQLLERLLAWLNKTAPDVHVKAMRYLNRVKKELSEKSMEIRRWVALTPISPKSRRRSAQLMERLRSIWRSLLDFLRGLVNKLIDFVKEREIIEDEVEDATNELLSIVRA